MFIPIPVVTHCVACGQKTDPCFQMSMGFQTSALKDAGPPVEERGHLADMAGGTAEKLVLHPNFHRHRPLHHDSHFSAAPAIKGTLIKVQPVNGIKSNTW